MEMAKTERGEITTGNKNIESFSGSSTLNIPKTCKSSSIIRKFEKSDNKDFVEQFIDGYGKLLPEYISFKNGLNSRCDELISGSEPDNRLTYVRSLPDVNDNVHAGQQIAEDSFNISDDTAASRYNLKMLLDIYSKVEGHKCRFCDYAATERSTLKRHLLAIHLNIKNAKCQLCQYRTTDRFKLARHTSVVHLKLKKYECHLCSFRSSQKAGLTHHINAIHLQLKNHECHLCSFKTSGKSNLKRHIRGVHLRLRRHACHLCEFRATEMLTLKNHVNGVHYRLKDFKCEFCSFSTTLSSNLQRHVKRIHLKRFN